MSMDPNRERLRELKPDSPLYNFRCFVESMVEEIILEDKPFDSYKDELKKRCEDVGVDYVDLECEGGAILKQSDKSIDVLLFPDTSEHSVTVCGKYKSGLTFRCQWKL